jgi:hypothetical protein
MPLFDIVDRSSWDLSAKTVARAVEAVDQKDAMIRWLKSLGVESKYLVEKFDDDEDEDEDEVVLPCGCELIWVGLQQVVSRKGGLIRREPTMTLVAETSDWYPCAEHEQERKFWGANFVAWPHDPKRPDFQEHRS